MNKISPFKTDFPDMPEIAGVTLATTCSGMRYKDRDDLLLVRLAEGTSVAGVFTKNTLPGAPIDWGRSILPSGSAQGLIVNAGIANVFTGTQGEQVVKHTAQHVADLFSCPAEHIYVSSTGTIGEIMDENYIKDSLPKLYNNLSPENWYDAAKAFMTTDTFPKGTTCQTQIGDVNVTINGITKGSGMIQPDMATMLGYVFTDANIPANILQELLTSAIEKSYNCSTVDSDTSTSDTVLLFATGQAENKAPDSVNDPDLSNFKAALNNLVLKMAHLVIKDGEGITKFVTINVKGADSRGSAKNIAFSIANSPLVKTAIAGEDPNWGRIVMAVGKSGEPVSKNNIAIWLADILIAKGNMQHPDYVEKDAATYMKGEEILLTVDVGVGDGEATVWTCDLTHDYISINADYRS